MMEIPYTAKGDFPTFMHFSTKLSFSHSKENIYTNLQMKNKAVQNNYTTFLAMDGNWGNLVYKSVVLFLKRLYFLPY